MAETRDCERPNIKDYSAVSIKPSTGQIGRATSSSDNGLYIIGKIDSLDVHFLVDSGATATLISKETYEKCGYRGDSQLYRKDMIVKGVDGNNINVYGCADLKIRFGDYETKVTVIVSEISLQGIIGQDFLLNNVKRWDLESLELLTKDNKAIHCYTKESSRAVCRVHVDGTITVPPRSCMMVPVKIPNAEVLPDAVLIDIEGSRNTSCTLVSGIIDPHNTNIALGLLNQTDEETIIINGQELGTCQPATDISFDDHIDSLEHIASVLLGKDTTNVIPEHLREMFDKSVSELTTSEKEQFRKLLITYQDVFAKSSDDLGSTNLVKHSINTGQAAPIRQPPRRLPYGKRETERQEVKNMLTRNVI